jgi:hypothetical protein
MISTTVSVAVIAGAIVTSLSSLLGLFVIVTKLTTRWSRIEGKQENIVSRISDLVTDNDKVHAVLVDSLNKLNDRQWELHTLIMQDRRG